MYSVACQDQKALEPLKLETIVSCLIWVLGTENCPLYRSTKCREPLNIYLFSPLFFKIQFIYLETGFHHVGHFGILPLECYG